MLFRVAISPRQHGNDSVMPNKKGKYRSGFILLSAWVVCLCSGMQVMADDTRIQAELEDPAPTLNPLRKALGENGYQRAMESGKYHYVGNVKCRLCHRDFFVGRKKDPHVNTFERLVATNHSRNSRCLGCHTTGHGVPSGFTDFKRTPKLVGVQCEGCHGPGSEHVRLHADDGKRFGVPVLGNISSANKGGKKEIKGGFLAGTDRPRMIKRMCLSCHTKRWGRSFERTAHGFKAAYDWYKTPMPGDDDSEEGE